MKRFVFYLLCLCSLRLYARDVPRAAVPIFITDSADSIVLSDNTAIRAMVTTHLKLSGLFEVIDTNEIDTFIAENNINLKQIFKPEYKEQLQNSNINFLVTGFLDVYKKQYRLTLMLFNILRGDFSCEEIFLMNKTPRAIKTGVEKATELFLNKYENAGLWDYNEKPNYKLGDRGPAGGIIFFVKGKRTNGWQYLEAAPAATEFKAPWGYLQDGYYGPDGADTTADLGDGKLNTNNLTSRLFVESNSGVAAYFCEAMSYNNYTDWYLPSKDELSFMYKNIALQRLDKYSDVPYWSSTQSTDKHAWFQNFQDGKQYYNGLKTDIYSVRAIRSF